MASRLERVGREVMGWIGSQPLKGPYPWDVGMAPETASLDEQGKPHGAEDVTFFSAHKDYLLVYGPKDRRGSRGPAQWFNPFIDARSAQMVLEKLGQPSLIFDAVETVLRGVDD